MAKKFFYNRVYNTRRMIINFVIIAVCIIGVILCFIITSNSQLQGNPNETGALSIKENVVVEINDNITDVIFFSKIENVDMKNVKIAYPENFTTKKIGKYPVKITVNEEEYESIVDVVDTTMPDLKLKEVSINEGGSYKLADFIESCTDNSGTECKTDYYKDGKDQNGNAIDYSNYKTTGTHSIKISASDDAGNVSVKETKLTINKRNQEIKPTPVNCKYGNNKYDNKNYIIAVDITTSGCAVSLDLYQDESMTAGINKIMEAETVKIKKDVEALNLSGTLALNRKITAVVNESGTGIVGYELRITVNETNNAKTETVVDYKLDASGNRVFNSNPHKLK